MGIIGYVLIGLLVVTGVYVATMYNNLVRLKHTVTKNWSNIGVLLKQRHDELTAAYRSKAIGGLALFLIACVALAVTLTARFAG
jgi:ABC-type Fe3+ transport system permease subunit